MLISEDYRILNKKLHENPKYGSRKRPAVYANIKDLMDKTGSKTILDYGCGKGTMADYLDDVTLYDPCMPEFSKRPDGPFDTVACCDVLEHVEPAYLDNVLDDIKSLATKAVYLVISTRPASKVLEDGRNAHLIIQPRDWWEKRLAQTFTTWQLTIKNSDISELIVLGVKNGSR